MESGWPGQNVPFEKKTDSVSVKVKWDEFVLTSSWTSHIELSVVTGSADARVTQFWKDKQ